MDHVVNQEYDLAPDIDAAVRQRDDQRCCVTGWYDNVKPTYIISPSILRDADLQPEVCLQNLQT